MLLSYLITNCLTGPTSEKTAASCSSETSKGKLPTKTVVETASAAAAAGFEGSMAGRAATGQGQMRLMRLDEPAGCSGDGIGVDEASRVNLGLQLSGKTKVV